MEITGPGPAKWTPRVLLAQSCQGRDPPSLWPESMHAQTLAQGPAGKTGWYSACLHLEKYRFLPPGLNSSKTVHSIRIVHQSRWTWPPPAESCKCTASPAWQSQGSCTSYMAEPVPLEHLKCHRTSLLPYSVGQRRPLLTQIQGGHAGSVRPTILILPFLEMLPSIASFHGFFGF